MAKLARLPLICAPTPLHRLDRLSERLGAELWIKRDDLTGFALGGNKGRKLEYLMPDVLASGAEVVVASGAAQSNFVRQLGAACAVHGIRCVAAVMRLPFESAPPQRPGLEDRGGNVLLDALLGVELARFPDGTWDELAAAASALADGLEREGRTVYRMPVGGSSPLGAYGFLQAGRELEAQLRERGEPEFDAVVFASSSGSTQVGLSWHFRGSKTVVRGVACDPEPDLVRDFAALGAGLCELISEGPPLGPEAYLLDLDFVGDGYGVPSAAGEAATAALARTEGIFLDPVYTAKAFAGLLARLETGELGGRVLFWHTGGAPGLFAAPL